MTIYLRRTITHFMAIGRRSLYRDDHEYLGFSVRIHILPVLMLWTISIKVSMLLVLYQLPFLCDAK